MVGLETENGSAKSLMVYLARGLHAAEFPLLSDRQLGLLVVQSLPGAGIWEGSGQPVEFRHGQRVAFAHDGECRHYCMAGLNRHAAIVIYWNTAHLGEVFRQRKYTSLTVEPELLTHILPLGWAHILLTGRIPVAKAPVATLVYDSAPYRNRPVKEFLLEASGECRRSPGERSGPGPLQFRLPWSYGTSEPLVIRATTFRRQAILTWQDWQPQPAAWVSSCRAISSRRRP